MTFRELRAKLMEMNETDLDEEVQCVLSDSDEVFSLTNIVDEAYRSCPPDCDHRHNPACALSCYED